MGYQAILFCPDEKLARIVSQVFSELDFAVEAVNEPFAAVKKLMAQKYDAIVVDCDNEQNTSLLFKSARNSSFNQSALAIALVEGQVGVAKAYRIGANLVLTKPINVEQAKGTLRVARGLLRKSSEATTPSGSATTAAPPIAPKPVATPPVRPLQPVARKIEVAQPPAPSSRPATLELKPPLPAMAASAKAEEKAAPVIPATIAPTISQPELSATSSIEMAGPSAEAAKEVATVESPRFEVPKPAAPPVSVITSTNQAAAAAPAPARETTAKADAVRAPSMAETDSDRVLEEIESEPIAPKATRFSTDAGTYSDGPSFAALGVDEGAETGGKKKIFLVLAVVLALIVATYFGLSALGSSHKAVPQPPVNVAPQPTPDGAPADIKPMSAPEPAPETPRPDRATVTAPAPASGKSSAQDRAPATSAPVTRIEISSEIDANKTAPAPLVVKSAPAPARKASQATADDAAQAPNPLAVATPSDGNLGGIIASTASSNQPVLARINVSQGVSQGLVIKRVQPQYPPSALAAHKQGAVQIEATVDKQGNVVNPKVLSGDPILAAAAIKAVRQWRYKPYYLDGQPVEIETQITVNFKASN